MKQGSIKHMSASEAEWASTKLLCKQVLLNRKAIHTFLEITSLKQKDFRYEKLALTITTDILYSLDLITVQ